MSAEKEKRNCPNCGGEIFAQAIKCKHCKSEIEPVNDDLSKSELNVCHYCGEPKAANEEACDECKVKIDYKKSQLSDTFREQSKQKGNTASNIYNGGIAAIYNDWIYFVNDLDEDRIYKMHNTGGAIYKVTEMGHSILTCLMIKYFLSKLKIMPVFMP